MRPPSRFTLPGLALAFVILTLYALWTFIAWVIGY